MPKARYAPLQRMILFGETSEPRADVSSEGGLFIEDPVSLVQAARVGESDEHRFRSFDDTDKDSNIQDGDTSCLATGTMSNVEETSYRAHILMMLTMGSMIIFLHLHPVSELVGTGRLSYYMDPQVMGQRLICDH
ncbi:hypothetical protein T459_26220 [Capsicum annuum]|uniref:Uncharacterized protein n=1 Tax=Capsicum annuum TaxID=4072 RepID=A0A2G2YN04_CAPAN|nr:hypothetical protein T459_26220 [Capsicum annuum]